MWRSIVLANFSLRPIRNNRPALTVINVHIAMMLVIAPTLMLGGMSTEIRISELFWHALEVPNY